MSLSVCCSFFANKVATVYVNVELESLKEDVRRSLEFSLPFLPIALDYVLEPVSKAATEWKKVKIHGISI